MISDRYPHPDADNFYPCGCLINDAGAHRGDGASGGPCPDFETVRLVPGTNRLDEMTWKRREGR
jgi:hypothetical protein